MVWKRHKCPKRWDIRHKPYRDLAHVEKVHQCPKRMQNRVDHVHVITKKDAEKSSKTAKIANKWFGPDPQKAKPKFWEMLKNR